MAYNPFDFFRKNQKVFFAGLTIVVMFMFVLSFGQGDFFTWFPRWLSAQKSYGDVQAVIDGEKIRESDLSKANAKRNLANQYMLAAAEKQRLAVNKQFFDLQAKASEETKMAVGQAFQSVAMPRQFAQFIPTAAEDLDEQERKAVLVAQARLADYLNRPDLKSDDKSAVEFAIKRLNAEMQAGERLVAAGGKRGEANVYFAAMPNRSMRDQLEYLLWLKKADQLGIHFTAEDVKRLVDVEFPDVTPSDLDALAGETLRGGARRRTDADLTDALADEFRVRAAQTAVLGVVDVRFHGGLPPAVPLDLFEFYKAQTSPAQYTFLKVPTDAFLPLVQGEPTDAELKKIFADARTVEPDPSNPRFGIKEPRKIKVQWAEVSGSEAYYDGPSEAKLKQLVAARAAAATPAAAVLVGTAGSLAFGDTKYDEYTRTQADIARRWAEAFSNPGKPRLNLEPIAAAVGGAVMGDPAQEGRKPGRPLSDPSATLADTSVARPQTAGVLAGLFGGSFATGGGLMTAPVLATEVGYRVEHERRLLAGIQGFVLPTLPGGPAVLEQLAGEFSIQAALPPPLPKATVQPLLDQRTKAELRYQVATDDVKAFQEKLAEVMKKDDKAAAAKEAAEYTAKFIADRGLKTGASTDLRDIHTIADDPGVAALVPKSRTADEKLGVLSNPLRKSAFGATLFFRLRADRGAEPATGVYAPAAYPPDPGVAAVVRDGQPLTLTWRTEETRAEAPREFGAAGVREKCVQVWKRQKARELARQAVDAAAAKVKEAGEQGVVVNLKLQDALGAIQAKFANPADKAAFRLIDDPKYTVAKLVRDQNERSPLAGMDVRLQPFNLLAFRGTDDFVYPTAKMNDELLAGRDKPVGTTVVLADAPETTLYVAALTAKDTASPFAFRETIYRRPRSPGGFDLPGAKDLVEGRYAADARKAQREQAVALLKAEFGYTNEHADLDKKAADSGE